jgi:NADH-quinone oxidoreductase subunit L
MWVPLVVLAILATVGGFVGISTAFTGGKHVGGRLNIVNWMEPIIWNPVTKGFGSGHSVEPRETGYAPLNATVEAGHETAGTHTSFNLAHAIEAVVHSHTVTEWIFIIISLIVAGIGIGLGVLFYLKKPSLADVWAKRLRPLYVVSYNKYWIDEFFGLTVTRRTMDLARAVYTFDSKVVDGVVNGLAGITRLTSRITGGTDKYLVDGLVNAIANFVVRLMSPIVRAAQTGFIQNYALVMVIGLLVAVSIYLIRAF